MTIATMAMNLILPDHDCVMESALRSSNQGGMLCNPNFLAHSDKFDTAVSGGVLANLMIRLAIATTSAETAKNTCPLDIDPLIAIDGVLASLKPARPSSYGPGEKPQSLACAAGKCTANTIDSDPASAYRTALLQRGRNAALLVLSA
jgi:hypothetical protein